MKLVYDKRKMRPGGMRLQSIHGCDLEALLAFDTRCWLLERTPDMTILYVTERELKKLVDETPNAKPAAGSWGAIQTK
jgi:hypothetical protein